MVSALDSGLRGSGPRPGGVSVLCSWALLLQWGYCSLELIDVLELALHYCMTTKHLFDKLPNFPQNLRSSGPVRGI